ncbi:D-mannonate epimerase [bacterium E08(2017)]|nr:D-mannonate epimerase [bacterium E08(2017)]
MLLYSKGSETDVISSADLKAGLIEALDKLGPRNNVLILPPDITRFHSRAGELTQYVYEYYGEAVKAILPAIGTHFPMTEPEIEEMFGDIPRELFIGHDWRNDVVTLGEVPGEFVAEVSEGAVDYSWPAQVNKIIRDGGFDLVLSVGQVVPHEVVGMANHSKNIFVGTGGAEAINKSHFLGAAYGMERMMGRALTPVRQVLDYACEHFLTDIPVLYVQTVVGRADDGDLVTRGMYIGEDLECFELAAKLSLAVNFEMLDEPVSNVLVYLDPSEFKSTWLGNKAIYRTRMAIADGGKLTILGPGVKEFGEDGEIDRLIRKYGYVGTKEVLRLVQENDDLRNNLSAAAHLIHGSTEDRFTVIYCTGGLTKEEVEAANFEYADVDEMTAKYQPANLKDGLNTLPDGEEVFYISNPAIGLWSSKERFGG